MGKYDTHNQKTEHHHDNHPECPAHKNHMNHTHDTLHADEANKGHKTQAEHLHEAHAHDTHSGHDHHADHHAAHPGHPPHDHSHHIEAFRKRFWISLILTIPVLILSEMIQMWLGFRLALPFHPYLLFALSTLIFFYGGWPFLTGAVEELKNRQPGMMTLIGTAITVAFIYSSATVFFIRGHDFFWELATLIVIMLLGHWVEARSVQGASRALEELVKIMPTTAHLLRDGQVIDVPVSDLIARRPGAGPPRRKNSLRRNRHRR